ncbi:MAG: DUF47 domain-containing protein [Deltaproteobacteria bacterium]|nr:DUF47 domain-containing protein [Deltaproteobacteria bacterium]
MSLFFKREKEVRQLIDEYFRVADETLDAFDAAFKSYLKDGICDKLREADGRIHASESRADDLRVEIEKMMYSHSLLPESRGDILGLLESFDKMPNLAETVTFMIVTQKIQVPPQFRPDFSRLLDCNMDAYHQVREAVDRLLANPDTVGAAVKPVDEKESESDRIERALITSIYDSDTDKSDRILLRELIERVGDISDNAERVAYRIEIIALKRRI